MSMYGHTNINIDALKRWANSLSLDSILEVEIGGENIVLNDKEKEILELQRQIQKQKPYFIVLSQNTHNFLCGCAPWFVAS